MGLMRMTKNQVGKVLCVGFHSVKSCQPSEVEQAYTILGLLLVGITTQVADVPTVSVVTLKMFETQHCETD